MVELTLQNCPVESAGRNIPHKYYILRPRSAKSKVKGHLQLYVAYVNDGTEPPRCVLTGFFRQILYLEMSCFENGPLWRVHISKWLTVPFIFKKSHCKRAVNFIHSHWIWTKKKIPLDSGSSHILVFRFLVDLTKRPKI